GGSKTKDALLVQVMDMILNNRTAGLIDLNINQKQLAQSAGSNTQIMKDYSAHIFSGSPKKGQSMDEVKDLLLQQIEKIKTGDFDEWMISAVVNDLKKNWQAVIENSNALAT